MKSGFTITNTAGFELAFEIYQIQSWINLWFFELLGMNEVSPLIQKATTFTVICSQWRARRQIYRYISSAGLGEVPIFPDLPSQ